MTNENIEPTVIEVLSEVERNWGVFCHIAVLAGIIIPFGNIIGPLVVWLIKREEMPFVDYNGKEVINFEISVFIAMGVSYILSFIIIGFFLMLVVALFAFIVTIMAAIKTYRGEYYRYPFSLRLIK